MSSIIHFIKKYLLKNLSTAMIIFSILLALIIYIRNPHKLVTNNIYNENEIVSIKEIKFPLVQNIKLDEDLLNQITIYFDDDSINDYDYTIKIYDDKGKKLYNQKYVNYESNIVLIDSRNLKKNNNYKLEIDCKSCENVKMAIGKCFDKKNKIQGTKNDSLKMTIDNYEKNINYYFVPLILFVISLLILKLNKTELKNIILKKISIKELIIYILLAISIILIIFIFFAKPKVTSHSLIYKENKEVSIKNVKFPLKQNIKLDEDNMRLISLYFLDDSINDFEYRISVYDDKDVLFSHNYVNYESNIVLIDAGPLEKNKNYILTIECDTCENVKLAIGDGINKYNKLNSSNKDSLKLTVDNLKINNNYYWYPLMMIAICLTLLPLARSKIDEKK